MSPRRAFFSLHKSLHYIIGNFSLSHRQLLIATSRCRRVWQLFPMIGGAQLSAARPGEVFCAHCMRRNPADATTCSRCQRRLGVGGDGFAVPRAPRGAAGPTTSTPYSVNISGGSSASNPSANVPVVSGIPVILHESAGAPVAEEPLGLANVPVLVPEQEPRRRTSTMRWNFVLTVGFFCFPCLVVVLWVWLRRLVKK